MSGLNGHIYLEVIHVWVEGVGVTNMNEVIHGVEFEG